MPEPSDLHDQGPPPADWSFPPLDPPPPYQPVLDVPAVDTPAVDTPVSGTPVSGTPVSGTPVSGPPALDAPVDHEAVAESGAAELPPSAAVLPVPRRMPAAGGPVSPVRALAGAAVAVAGVLLGIGALLWATDAPKGSPALQQDQAQTAQLSSTPSPLDSPKAGAVPVTPAPLRSTAPAVAATAPTPKLALTVLNNSTRPKLADRAAARFRAAGWPVKVTGNFRGRVTATTVYYAPGQLASAQLFARSFASIERVRPRFAGLPGTGLTVVLTRSYPG